MRNFCPRYLLTFATLAAVLFPLAAHAQTSADFTLTTADFATQSVTVRSVDATSLFVADGDGTRAIPLGQILDLTRQTTPSLKSVRLTLLLASGDRVAGEPAGIADDQLNWTAPLLGEMKIALRDVLSVTQGPGEASPAAGATQDVVHLPNGDTVRGVVSQLDSTGVTLSVDGSPTSLPLNLISHIDLAQTATTGAQVAASPRYRLRLVDRSVVTVEGFTADKTDVKFDLAGASRSIRWADVIALEQLDGPVSWLSARTPLEQIYTPHLPGRDLPAKPDRAVDGTPIRFGDRTYAHGIGVHSYSKLTYALDGTYKTFRTRYAIAGDLPYADVTVRVFLDGKIAHETKSFRAGILSDLVNLDISSNRALTLEVDYGAGNDVQDRLNWIEPALVR